MLERVAGHGFESDQERKKTTGSAAKNRLSTDQINSGRTRPRLQQHMYWLTTDQISSGEYYRSAAHESAKSVDK